MSETPRTDEFIATFSLVTISDDPVKTGASVRALMVTFSEHARQLERELITAHEHRLFAEHERNAATARERGMREALRPFAKAADDIVHAHLSGHAKDNDLYSVQVGNLFAARAALGEGK